MRTLLLLLAGWGLFGSAPAQAQFFLKAPDLRGAPVTGLEPEIVGQTLPGATQDEYRAALVWNLRAALNVAALQCDFRKMLLTVPNYNALLRNHSEELKSTYDVLTNYFNRTSADPKEGQRQFDQFSTRLYSGFSTVSAQLIFCQTAASVGRQALFTQRGGLHALAISRMRELRGSLVPWGEQQFPGGIPAAGYPFHIPKAFGDKRCWKRDEWQTKTCGAPFRGVVAKRR